MNSSRWSLACGSLLHDRAQEHRLGEPALRHHEGALRLELVDLRLASRDAAEDLGHHRRPSASRAADSAISHEIVEHPREHVRAARLIELRQQVARATPSACGARRTARTSRRPRRGRSGAAGIATEARGVGLSLSFIACSSITSASEAEIGQGAGLRAAALAERRDVERAGAGAATARVQCGAAAAAAALTLARAGAVRCGRRDGRHVDHSGRCHRRGRGHDRRHRRPRRPRRTARSARRARSCFASAPAPPSPTLASAARMRAEPRIPAGAAPASNTISRTPCAVIRRTTSDTPDSTLGTSCRSRRQSVAVARERHGAVLGDGDERAQRRLLLVDVGRLVQQQPDEPSVVPGEGDRMIHDDRCWPTSAGSERRLTVSTRDEPRSRRRALHRPARSRLGFGTSPPIDVRSDASSPPPPRPARARPPRSRARCRLPERWARRPCEPMRTPIASGATSPIWQTIGSRVAARERPATTAPPPGSPAATRALGLRPVLVDTAPLPAVPDRRPRRSSCLSYLQQFIATGAELAHAGKPEGVPTQNVVAVVPGSDPALRGRVRRPRRALRPPRPLARRRARSRSAATRSAMAPTTTPPARRPCWSSRDVFAAHPTRRSILVVHFSGEELGLLGSQWFVEHSPVPLDSIDAMLNFDMVGRLRNDRLIVYGLGTATRAPRVGRQRQRRAEARRS